MYVESITQSGSSTFSEARVRAVMQKTLDDFIGLAIADHLSVETASKWAKDLVFVLNHEAAELFQLRFDLPSGEQKAVNYYVSDDGSLVEDSESGGVNFRCLPKGTEVLLVLRLRRDSRHRARVLAYLAGQGWGTGSMLEGDGVHDRAYSADGYGLIRRRIGNWS